jgi:hypothetical protein
MIKDIEFRDECKLCPSLTSCYIFLIEDKNMQENKNGLKGAYIVCRYSFILKRKREPNDDEIAPQTTISTSLSTLVH